MAIGPFARLNADDPDLNPEGRPVFIQPPPPPPPPPIPDNDSEDMKRDDESYLKAMLIMELIGQSQGPGFFNGLEYWTTKATEGAEHLTQQATDAIQGATSKTGGFAERLVDHAPLSKTLRHRLKGWIARQTARLVRGEGAAGRMAMDAERNVGTAALKTEHASAITFGGKDPGYYADLAMVESGGNDYASPGTSSARGRYQFTEGTWVGVVKKHGLDDGMPPELRQAAQALRSGHVSGAERQAILDMRMDPRFSNPMIEAFTNDNAVALHHVIGDQPLTRADLYMAHFLGASTAARFILAREQNGSEIAANVVSSKAVHANKWVFYNHDGQARSLDQIYGRFAAKFGEQPVQYAQAGRPGLRHGVAAGIHADA